MKNVIFYLITGIVTAFALFVLHAVLGTVHSWSAAGYLIIGYGMIFFAWGAERLWFNMIATMMKEPFSAIAYISRIPFWFIAGGIGYTLGMLFAKKFDVMGFYDVPVKSLFIPGGMFGVIIQISMQCISFYILKKNQRVQKTTGHSTNKSTV